MRENTIALFGDGYLIKLIESSLKLTGISTNLYYDIKELEKQIKNKSEGFSICVVTDSINLKLLEQVENVLTADVYYTYIFNFFKYVFISPKRLLHDKGCTNCLFTRWIMTKKDRVRLFDIKKYLECNPIKFTVSHLTKPLANMISRFIINQEKSNLKAFIINRENLSFSLDSFLPISTCKKCGHLPEDSYELTSNEFVEIFKPKDSNGYRTHSINYLSERLEKYYLNKEMGIFNVVLNDVKLPFCVSVANLMLKNGKDEVGVGRANNYLHSQITAILEGLERYCGMEPRGKVTSIFNSYNGIKQFAINPEKFILHTEEQYEKDGFRFTKFNPDQMMPWVWAYSITNRRCVLVPETFGYYGINIRDGEQKSFVYEISNGCALGGSLLEAVLHGIFEVIERDSFLIAWYTKMPLPEIDINYIQNKTVKLMIKKFEYEHDYNVHLFDMTLDSKVPTIWALAKKNNDDEYKMNIMCSAGCHMDIERAIESAIHELCGILPALNDKFALRYEELKKMYSDFNFVKNMEDHTLMYGLKEAETEFDFLLKRDKNITTNRNNTIWYSGNALKDLIEIIKQLKNLDLEVIVVNQTAEEVKLSDLHCVKVIIPGMLPMTFGHRMRRINAERMLEVSQMFRHNVNNEDEIRLGDVAPHPFP